MGVWDSGGKSHSGVYILPMESPTQSPKWAGKKEDTTMTTTPVPTTTTQPPRQRQAESFINHMITSTRVTDDLYENYYWVNPYELIFAA